MPEQSFETLSREQLLAELGELRRANALLMAELEHRQTRYEQLFDVAPIGLLLLDGKGIVCVANRAAAQLCACEPADMIGKPFSVIAQLRDASAFCRHLQRSIEKLTLGHTEIELLRAGDETRTVELISAPLTDRLSGALLATVLIDVEERVERERALESAFRDWTSVVTHDLRQPLAAMQVWIQLLAGAAETYDDRTRRGVDALGKAIQKVVKMSGDLKEASLVEANQIELDKAPLRLSELVRKSIAALPPTVPLRLEIASDLPLIVADRPRLERVLEDLLTYALTSRKPETEVVVTVVQRGDKIELAVTGELLSPAELGTLFSRFYRAPSAGHERQRCGGLYVARAVIEAHGGRLWCDSADGRTTFHFTLPCGDQASEPQGEQPAVDSDLH
jgi:PAS domain S-box-containing protein